MKHVIALFIVAFSVGCSSGHKVNYKLTKNDAWNGKTIGGVVRVLPLVDQTTPIHLKTIDVPPYTYRVNYRKLYKNKEIATNATEMVIQHLRKSGLFTDVVGEKSPKSADMELVGTLTEYSARGRINKGAEATCNVCIFIGIPFVPLGPVLGALIGSGLTAGAKTEVQTAVSLSDVTLKSVGMTNVLWQNTINVKTNYVCHWGNASHPAVLINADNSLRCAVNDMIQQIGTSVSPQAATAQKP